MLTSRRICFGGLGPPAQAGRAFWPRVGVVLLALTALCLEGCSTLGLGQTANACGNESWLSKCRLTRMFRRDVIVTNGGCTTGGCAGEPVLSAPVVAAPLVTAPSAVVTPAPVLTPSTPAGEEAPRSLEPAIPPAESTAPAGEKTGTTSLNHKALYETQRPASGATTSRRPSAMSSTQTARSPDKEDPLIDLPPLSALAEPMKSHTPPVPPAAEPLAAVPAPTPAPSPSRPAVLTAESPPKPPAQALSLAEGIARFKVVRPQLAGGNLPTEAGWSFLVEKGYKTVLDLRPRGCQTRR